MTVLRRDSAQDRSLRIVFVGALRKGSTTLQRLDAMRDLGHEVTAIDTAPPDARAKQRSLPSRIRGRLYRGTGSALFRPTDYARANELLAAQLRAASLDVLWLDKGLTIERETLALAKRLHPACSIAGYSPDDMYQRHNNSPQFIDHLPFYDVFFTTKSYNVDELKSLGCRRVEFVQKSYDPHTHHPWHLSTEEKAALGGQVGFVGTYELDRAASLQHLAANGIEVRVWGEHWREHFRKHPGVLIAGHGLYGDDYARGICAFDINLCFLRKLNRDQQTSRSIEIPACGAFMLAERTAEHLELFEEGKEAEFFASDAELLDKVRYYLAHPDERARIALAGRERCLRDGYSNQERIARMLDLLAKLREQGGMGVRP